MADYFYSIEMLVMKAWGEPECVIYRSFSLSAAAVAIMGLPDEENQ